MEYFIKKKGFTLIELTIIFSVIAILSVIGLSISIDYNRTQIINSAYEELRTTLFTAKSRALSQNKPDAGCSGSLVSFEVVTTTSTQYDLQVVCSASSYIMKTVNLPAGLSFSPFTSGYKISFPVLVGGSSGGTITISGYNKTKTISVDSSGNIQ